MTHIDINSYLRNFDTCPVCGAEDSIEESECLQISTENNIPVNTFTQSIECTECGEEWAEVWQLITVRAKSAENNT